MKNFFKSNKGKAATATALGVVGCDVPDKNNKIVEFVDNEYME